MTKITNPKRVGIIGYGTEDLKDGNIDFIGSDLYNKMHNRVYWDVLFVTSDILIFTICELIAGSKKIAEEHFVNIANYCNKNTVDVLFICLPKDSWRWRLDLLCPILNRKEEINKNKSKEPRPKKIILPICVCEQECRAEIYNYLEPYNALLINNTEEDSRDMAEQLINLAIIHLNLGIIDFAASAKGEK